MENRDQGCNSILMVGLLELVNSLFQCEAYDMDSRPMRCEQFMVLAVCAKLNGRGRLTGAKAVHRLAQLAHTAQDPREGVTRDGLWAVRGVTVGVTSRPPREGAV